MPSSRPPSTGRHRAICPRSSCPERGRIGKGMHMRKLFAAGLLVLCAVPAFAEGVEGADLKAIKRMQQTKRRPDPKGGVVQVTGKDTQVGQTVFPVRVGGDPFAYVKPNGTVTVLTSDPHVLELKSLDDLLRGGPFKVKSNEQYIEG